MVAFTGRDADIATRVTSMGDMTGMVFLLLRKHRQSPQTLGVQWQQAASLEYNIQCSHLKPPCLGLLSNWHYREGGVIERVVL